MLIKNIANFSSVTDDHRFRCNLLRQGSQGVSWFKWVNSFPEFRGITRLCQSIKEIPRFSLFYSSGPFISQLPKKQPISCFTSFPRQGPCVTPWPYKAFLFLYLVRSGCDLGGHSSFLCLCWPGMVHNQRQLSIVVSDWESYLGSLFSTLVCGIMILHSCCGACQTLCLFLYFVICRSSLLKIMNSFHAELWSHSSNDGRNR